ncbi:MAG: hypothetical protein CL583_16355 [Alteromonadaceae bacterium]|nr:hypothetical protein [Alteromonadaceae bacterium]
MKAAARSGLTAVTLAFVMNVMANPVYRCESADGISYGEFPCEPGSEPMERDVPDRPGTFQVLPIPRVPSQQPGNANKRHDLINGPDTPAETGASPCRFFQSTVLRTHLIRGEVLPGMRRTDVTKAWGDPAESWQEPVEMWTYETRYHGRLARIQRVYFEEGCVTTIESAPP